MGTKAYLVAYMEDVSRRTDKTAEFPTFLDAAQLWIAQNYEARGLMEVRAETLTIDSQGLIYDGDYLRTMRVFIRDTVNEKGRLLGFVSREYFYENHYYPSSSSSFPKYFTCDYTQWLFEPPPNLEYLADITMVIAPRAITDNQGSMLENGDDAIVHLASGLLLWTLEEMSLASSLMSLADTFIKNLVHGQESRNLQAIDGRD